MSKEGCFYPVQSSDGDASPVLRDVLSSGIFYWAIFWPSYTFKTCFWCFTSSKHSWAYSIDFGLYIFFKEVLRHVILLQLTAVFIKLCGSLEASGMVRPKYLNEIKKLAKYLRFDRCGIPCAFEWYQINDLISIDLHHSLLNFVHYFRDRC